MNTSLHKGSTFRRTPTREREKTMKRNLFLVVTASSLGFVACQKQSATKETTMHAAVTAAPGSYEDWCGEHAVPESMCTRCNPSLVPAFKATGDWCNEHGLPESQCKLCNPNLKIERPAKKEGAR